jgi:hypothetical protein
MESDDAFLRWFEGEDYATAGTPDLPASDGGV